MCFPPDDCLPRPDCLHLFPLTSCLFEAVSLCPVLVRLVFENQAIPHHWFSATSGFFHVWVCLALLCLVLLLELWLVLPPLGVISIWYITNKLWLFCTCAAWCCAFGFSPVLRCDKIPLLGLIWWLGRPLKFTDLTVVFVNRREASFALTYTLSCWTLMIATEEVCNPVRSAAGETLPPQGWMRSRCFSDAHFSCKELLTVAFLSA